MPLTFCKQKTSKNCAKNTTETTVTYYVFLLRMGALYTFPYFCTTRCFKTPPPKKTEFVYPSPACWGSMAHEPAWGTSWSKIHFHTLSDPHLLEMQQQKNRAKKILQESWQFDWIHGNFQDSKEKLKKQLTFKCSSSCVFWSGFNPDYCKTKPIADDE